MTQASMIDLGIFMCQIGIGHRVCSVFSTFHDRQYFPIGREMTNHPLEGLSRCLVQLQLSTEQQIGHMSSLKNDEGLNYSIIDWHVFEPRHLQPKAPYAKFLNTRRC